MATDAQDIAAPSPRVDNRTNTASVVAQVGASSSARRVDIDWLRIGATYLLFLFHAGKVFDPAPFFHIRNDELSVGFTIFCGLIGIWHMPMFFLLAGWSAAGSLRKRGATAFLGERMHRLLLPLVVGSATMGPIMKYIELSSGLDLNHRALRVAGELQEGVRVARNFTVAPPFDETFMEFLPTFFSGLDRFTWGHLWFLAYLLALTIALLPLLGLLLRKRDRVRNPAAWMLYLPIAPLVAVQLVLRPYWPGIYNLYDDWANVGYFAIYVVAGFVLATQPVLEKLLLQEWKRSLAIAVTAAFPLLLGRLGLVDSPTMMLVAPAIAGWCFVAAFLGIGRLALNRTGPLLDYLSESAFPVYLLHQLMIIVIGYPLLRLPLGIFAKYWLLVASSLAATMAVYHWLVRPFAGPRYLLGMKAQPEWGQVLKTRFLPADRRTAPQQ